MDPDRVVYTPSAGGTEANDIPSQRQGQERYGLYPSTNRRDHRRQDGEDNKEGKRIRPGKG